MGSEDIEVVVKVSTLKHRHNREHIDKMKHAIETKFNVF